MSANMLAAIAGALAYAALVVGFGIEVTSATTSASAPGPTMPSYTMSTMAQRTCAFASIMDDDSVIIDWQCVSVQAAEYKARRDRSSSSAFAFVLESLRNGTAVVK